MTRTLAYEIQVKKLRKERRTLEQAITLERQCSEAQLSQVNELALRADDLETELKRKSSRLRECEEDNEAQRRTSLIYQSRAAEVGANARPKFTFQFLIQGP